MKTFENASFVPMFLEDLSFPNETLRKQAEEACQGDLNCLFDSASTKDVLMGANTKALSSTLEEESTSLSKLPHLQYTKGRWKSSFFSLDSRFLVQYLV